MNIPFNKIIVIHCSDNHVRYDFIKNWIKEYDLEDNVDIWWTCKKKINTFCGNRIGSLKCACYDEALERTPNIYGNVYDCGQQHFSIIKTSYERGLDSILIIEDDFGFSEGIDKLKEVFNNLPHDWDIIKFDTFFEKGWYTESGDYFRECYDDDMKFGAMCYALNRNGMKAVIDSYENIFRGADSALYEGLKDKQVKAYVGNYRIGRLGVFDSSIDENK